jgi:hypothetical protein
MNIDLLADNPSVKWYFIVAVPFLVLVLGVAFFMQNLVVIKASVARFTLNMSPRASSDLPHP